MKSRKITFEGEVCIEVQVSRIQGLGTVHLYNTDEEGSVLIYEDEIDLVIESLIQAKSLLIGEFK